MEEVSKGWPEARSVKDRSAGSWRAGGVERQEVKARTRANERSRKKEKGTEKSRRGGGGHSTLNL